MKLSGLCTLLAFATGLLTNQAVATNNTTDNNMVRQLQSLNLVDSNAIPAAKALYRNLGALRGKSFLFGHEDSLAYGVNWEGDMDRSDVRDVTGDNPAVYGWELGGLELGREANLDFVNFKKIQEWIKAGYKRGGVITISWHVFNPVTGGDSWDTTSAVREIIPGGSKHDVLKKYLDTFVAFNEALVVTNSNGQQEKIPVIFRPWHEHNGDWFWWGKGRTSEDEYKKLFQFTVQYLRDQKKQHNLIYAFSPDRSRMDMNRFESEYLYGYPGDEYVDVIGLDNYWDAGHPSNWVSPDEQKQRMADSLRGIVQFAQARNKIAALTETGNPDLKVQKFWTERILQPMLADAQTQQVAYVLVWRNANRNREPGKPFFAPYPGQDTAEDFKQFNAHPKVLFESELPKMYQ